MRGAETFARVRDELHRHVFPDAPQAPRLSGDRALLYVALAVCAVVIQLLRMWSSNPLESLWAEDGSVWLPDARDGDPIDALTTPYNGYLQTSSRLVADLVAELPVAWYAAAMAICGTLIVAGCAFIVWRTSASQIHNRYLRAGLAAMVPLLGVVGYETLATVVNSIWFIAFACFWLLLWRPRSMGASVAIAALLFLGVVSHSATLFLAPLWLLRLVALRDRRDLVVVVGFAAGVCAQLIHLGLTGDPTHPFDPADPVAGEAFSTQPFWDWNLVPAYAQRIVGGAIAGQRVDGWLWDGLGWPFAIVLGLMLFGLVVWALRTPRTRVLVPLTVAISIVMFLVAGYVRWGAGGISFFWPEGGSDIGSARYMVPPTLLLLSAFFIQLDAGGEIVRRRQRVHWPVVQAVAVSVVIACALLSFSVGEPIARGSPAWSASVDQGRAECAAGDLQTVDLVTNTTPLGPEVMTVDCDALR